VTGEFLSLPALNTSRQSVYSFGIVNRGVQSIVAKIEISPNRKHYAEDAEQIVAGGQTIALVPIRFLRYTRISLRALEPEEQSIVDVYFQAQSVG
jgi:hypothetical protein